MLAPSHTNPDNLTSRELWSDLSYDERACWASGCGSFASSSYGFWTLERIQVTPWSQLSGEIKAALVRERGLGH